MIQNIAKPHKAKLQKKSKNHLTNLQTSGQKTQLNTPQTPQTKRCAKALLDQFQRPSQLPLQLGTVLLDLLLHGRLLLLVQITRKPRKQSRNAPVRDCRIKQEWEGAGMSGKSGSTAQKPGRTWYAAAPFYPQDVHIFPIQSTHRLKI